MGTTETQQNVAVFLLAVFLVGGLFILLCLAQPTIPSGTPHEETPIVEEL